MSWWKKPADIPSSFLSDRFVLFMTVIHAIEEQLRFYPLSSLPDIYKSFFQDEFGPGHLLSDRQKAFEYYVSELSGMRSRGRHKLELCGAGKNFCRLPLDLVLDGFISREDYFDAFLAGAEGFTLPDVGEWKSKWLTILDSSGNWPCTLENFKEDSHEILSHLTRGEYALNHSSRYRQAYDPHYRIFSRRQAEAVINNFLPPF